MRPACDNSTAAGGPGKSLNIVGITGDRVGNVVSAALGSPDEFVDRLTDTSANALMLFGRALAKIPGRIEHWLAKRCGQSWGEPDRQAGSPTHAPASSPNHEAAVSMRPGCVHLMFLS
jgi:hypothetical protein